MNACDGIVKTETLAKNGFTSRDIKRFVEDGLLERVKQGYYTKRQRDVSDIVIAANDTLNRAGELLQLQNYFRKREQKAAVSAKATGMEEMIIAAIQNNVSSEAIEAMSKTAGITDKRLEELREQAQQK